MIIKLEVKDRSKVTSRKEVDEGIVVRKIKEDNIVRLAKKHNIDGSTDIDNFWFGKLDFEDLEFKSFFESAQTGFINPQSHGETLIGGWDTFM